MRESASFYQWLVYFIECRPLLKSLKVKRIMNVYEALDENVSQETQTQTCRECVFLSNDIFPRILQPNLIILLQVRPMKDHYKKPELIQKKIFLQSLE